MDTQETVVAPERMTRSLLCGRGWLGFIVAVILGVVGWEREQLFAVSLLYQLT